MRSVAGTTSRMRRFRSAQRWARMPGGQGWLGRSLALPSVNVGLAGASNARVVRAGVVRWEPRTLTSAARNGEYKLLRRTRQQHGSVLLTAVVLPRTLPLPPAGIAGFNPVRKTKRTAAFLTVDNSGDPHVAEFHRQLLTQTPPQPVLVSSHRSDSRLNPFTQSTPAAGQCHPRQGSAGQTKKPPGTGGFLRESQGS